jgi:ABC-type transport system involved in cytochrome c biogenesis permease subunit
VRRITVAVALVGTLAWCLLLFGIGLDDLQSGRTEPGIVFAVVVLAVLIAGLVYAVWRAASPLRRQDRAASRR